MKVKLGSQFLVLIVATAIGFPRFGSVLANNCQWGCMQLSADTTYCDDDDLQISYDIQVAIVPFDDPGTMGGNPQNVQISIESDYDNCTCVCYPCTGQNYPCVGPASDGDAEDPYFADMPTQCLQAG